MIFPPLRPVAGPFAGDSPSPSGWRASIALHSFFGLLIALVLWPRERTPRTTDFEVYERPKLAAQPVVRISKPLEAKQRDPTKRKVFGASRNAGVNAEDSSAPSVKTGNTVAKAPDREKLRVDDEDSIPIPVEEYLVSAMPVLEREYRIPYPAEARRSGVQGRVVMDLIIDGEGRVRKAELVGGPGAGLNEAALAAVKNFKFKPARLQDRAVAVKIRYAYQFVLER